MLRICRAEDGELFQASRRTRVLSLASRVTLLVMFVG